MSNQYKNATNSKIKRIFSSTKGVDCIIIANSNSMDPNFRYLTNFSSGLFEGSFLIVSKGRLKLLTSNLEYDTAVSQAHDAIEVIKITNRDQLIKALSSEISGKSIGLNYAFIPYSIYAFIKKAAKPGRITDAYPALLLARLVKDEKEISYIRKAAAITKKAMAAIEEKFRVGITEKELASEFDGISASYGSSAPSFRTIVCFGQNAALPHHFPPKRRLGEKDEILIDAGATVNGYCSDITRTFIERCRGSPKWEAHPGYIMPVGVWNVREHVREALRGAPLSFGNINDLFAHLRSKLDIPVHDWMENSALLRNVTRQRRLA